MFLIMKKITTSIKTLSMGCDFNMEIYVNAVTHKND